MHSEALFTVFGKNIYLYGIFIGLGIVACFIVFLLYTNHEKINRDLQDFVFFTAVISIAVGFFFAKLYQAIYNFIEDGHFDLWNSGITVMGGLIGGAISFLSIYFGIGHLYFNRDIYKKKKIDGKAIHVAQFNIILRVAPLCILIAHGFGRIGCLMAGCCHGEYLGIEPTAGGMFMHPFYEPSGYYVPTQLYEALFLFALFGILSLLFFKKSNIIMQLYLIFYGIWRIIIEFFRADSRGAIVLGLAPSQWQSFVFILLGICLILFYYFKKMPFVLREEKTEKIEKTIENN